MSQKGMTLIEATCSLLLISILVTVIRPSMMAIEHLKFNNFISEVHTGIVTAQQIAHLRNTPYTLSNQGEYIRIYSSGTSISDEQKLMIPSGISVWIGDKALNTPFNLGFNSDMSPSQAGTITLTNNKLNKEIQITVRPVTGKVTIYR